MSSFAAIYDFEAQLEAAFIDFLNTVSVAAMGPDALIAFQKATPRTEAMFTEGGAIDTHRFQTYDGNYRHDLYQGSLTLRLITRPRTKDGEANTAHSTYRAKIRNMMSRAKQEVEMDNLELRYLVPSGNSPSIKSEDGYEMSTMTFQITFGIKTGVWPADAETAYSTEE